MRKLSEKDLKEKYENMSIFPEIYKLCDDLCDEYNKNGCDIIPYDIRYSASFVGWADVWEIELACLRCSKFNCEIHKEIESLLKERIVQKIDKSRLVIVMVKAFNIEESLSKVGRENL